MSMTMDELKQKHDYPTRWDLATCIAARLEDTGLVAPGAAGIAAHDIIAEWLAVPRATPNPNQAGERHEHES